MTEEYLYIIIFILIVTGIIVYFVVPEYIIYLMHFLKVKINIFKQITI